MDGSIQIRDAVIRKFRESGVLSNTQEADRLDLKGEPGYPDDRSCRILSEMYGINLAVYNVIIDPPTMSIYGNMGVDGSDPASLVLRHLKVADGDGHLSEHFDIIVHGTQTIQRPRKQPPIDSLTPGNLDDAGNLNDDSQQSSYAGDEEELIIERLLASRIKIDDPSLRILQYLVKWLGFDVSTENTWEPHENLGGDASTLIKDLAREETITKD